MINVETLLLIAVVFVVIFFIGSYALFSGWRRIRPFSRKKRLTVASSADSSSPTSATTMSPSRASCCLLTTT